MTLEYFVFFLGLCMVIIALSFLIVLVILMKRKNNLRLFILLVMMVSPMMAVAEDDEEFLDLVDRPIVLNDLGRANEVFTNALGEENAVQLGHQMFLFDNWTLNQTNITGMFYA